MGMLESTTVFLQIACTENERDHCSDDGTNENRNGQLMVRRIMSSEEPDQPRSKSITIIAYQVSSPVGSCNISHPLQIVIPELREQKQRLMSIHKSLDLG